MSTQIREQVSLGSRILGAAGLDDYIWGHASVRDPDGRGAWLKRAGIGLSEVTPDDVHLVSREGDVIEGAGERHIEYPIHTELLSARPDIDAVVHIHPPHAIALAASGVALRAFGHAGSLFTPPGVPRFDLTSDLIRSAELGAAVAGALGDRNAVFLVNHGIVTVGVDLPTAALTAMLLEEACHQQLLTLSYGGEPTWTPDAEAVQKRERIYSARAVQNVWVHLSRKLESGAGV
jgi:ribulose-5-phosphate 4-epimerase/fuculose-1-phosphate aldolase